MTKRKPDPRPGPSRQETLPDEFLSRYPPRPPAGPPEVVSPGWLGRALGLTLAVAVGFSYLSVCLLLWIGAWQLVLHPSTRVDKTPGVPFQAIRFDAAETGVPRLTGWWIPGTTATTVLYLHGADGSLANTVDELDVLHASGASIFAIDYRGYGQSSGPHPTQQQMQQDARAALSYLLDTRHVAPAAVVPYGVGVGCVLAAQLAVDQPALPAVVLENPALEIEQKLLGEGRAHLLPVHWLLRERFDLPATLQPLHKPKLLLARTGSPAKDAEDERFFRTVSDPSLSVQLSPADEANYLKTLSRFFGEYLPAQDLQAPVN